jgi:uncharacterized protein YodC (DUF2158 family)
MAIQVGDIVRLKSGGPKMTVQERYNNEWLCKWFDSRNETCCEPFAEALLEVILDRPGMNFESREESPYVDVSKF